MKDLKKRIESNISTPIKWYGIILSTAIVFIIISCIISFFTNNQNWWGLLFLNFGYGTFASLIVSLLIDIGNTKRSKYILDSKYELLTRECKDRCDRLRHSVWNCMEDICSNSDVMTYEECIEEALTPNYDTSFMDEEQYHEYLYSVVEAVDSLREAAEKLTVIIPFCYDEKINVGFCDNLRKLSCNCKMIKRDCDNKRYDRCFNNLICIKNSIIRCFPELENDFTKPYSNDDEVE